MYAAENLKQLTSYDGLTYGTDGYFDPSLIDSYNLVEVSSSNTTGTIVDKIYSFTIGDYEFTVTNTEGKAVPSLTYKKPGASYYTYDAKNGNFSLYLTFGNSLHRNVKINVKAPAGKIIKKITVNLQKNGSAATSSINNVTKAKGVFSTTAGTPGLEVATARVSTTPVAAATTGISFTTPANEVSLVMSKSVTASSVVWFDCFNVTVEDVGGAVVDNFNNWVSVPASFSYGNQSQDMWQLYTPAEGDDVLMLNNINTEKLLKSAWISSRSFTLVGGKVYSLEYTTAGATNENLELYLCKDADLTNVVKIGGAGPVNKNISVETGGSYYLAFRGYKNASGTIEVNSINLAEIDDVANQAITDSDFGAPTADANPTYGDWTIVNANTQSSDQYAWGPGANAGEMYLNTSGGVNSDDWLIRTNGVELTAGEVYKISFSLKTDAASAEKIYLYAATSSDVPTLKAASNLLWSNTNFTNTAGETQEVKFVPDADGTYYFGFWDNSFKNRSGLTVSGFSVASFGVQTNTDPLDISNWTSKNNSGSVVWSYSNSEQSLDTFSNFPETVTLTSDQAYILKAGKTYRLSFDFKTKSSGAYASDTETLRVYYADNAAGTNRTQVEIDGITSVNSKNNGTYTTKDCEITVAATDAVYLIFEGDRASGSNGMYVKNVHLFEVESVPFAPFTEWSKNHETNTADNYPGWDGINACNFGYYTFANVGSELDGWLLSPAVSLEAATRYTVAFDFQAKEMIFNVTGDEFETARLYLCNADNCGDVVGNAAHRFQLIDTGAKALGTEETFSMDFYPEEDGNYYFAYQIVSHALAGNGVEISNMKLEVNPISNNATEAFFPKGINKLEQVANFPAVADWTNDDANGWSVGNGYAMYQSGSESSWLISPAVTLTAGQQYSFGFEYSADNYNDPGIDHIKVHVINVPQAPAAENTVTILNLENLDGSEYSNPTEMLATFTSVQDGLYMFAFEGIPTANPSNAVYVETFGLWTSSGGDPVSVDLAPYVEEVPDPLELGEAVAADDLLISNWTPGNYWTINDAVGEEKATWTNGGSPYTTNSWLVSPKVALEADQEYTFSFDYESAGGTTGNKDKLTLLIINQESLGTGDGLTTSGDDRAAIIPTELLDVNCAKTLKQVSFKLENEGNYRFAIKVGGVSTPSQCIYVDNVRLNKSTDAETVVNVSIKPIPEDVTVNYAVGQTYSFTFVDAANVDGEIGFNGGLILETAVDPADDKLTVQNNGILKFKAPLGSYIKSVKLYTAATRSVDDFAVNVNGTSTIDDATFTWTAANGVVEDVVTFTSNSVVVINNFDVVFADPDTFETTPDENTHYASQIGIAQGLLDKGWKANDGSSWTANENGIRTTGESDNDNELLLSPRIHLVLGNEYVIKMSAENNTSNVIVGKYNYYIYSAQSAENLSNLTQVAYLESSANNQYEAVISPEENFDGIFVIKPVRNNSSYGWKGVTVTRFAVNELLKPADNVYKFKHADGYASEVLTRSTATVYNFSECEDEVSDVNPANPNAYVIGGANITTTTANKLAYDAETDSYSADAISITDGNAFHFGYEVSCNNVSYNRTGIIAETKYVTAVLPFAVDVQPGMAKINGFNGDDSAILFERITGNTVPAYTPFMYYKRDVEEFSFNGANVEAKAGSRLMIQDVEGSSWKQAFVLSETVIDDVKTDPTLQNYNVYYFSGGTFWLATGRLTLKPFRAIFLMENGGGAGAPSLKFLIDGDIPTGLEDLYYNEDAANEAPAYNEAGIRVNEGYKGITIRKGQKTIRK